MCSDEYFTALDLDPITKLGSFIKLNLRIEVARADDKWSVALVGKNLTDEQTTTWVNDGPFFEGACFGSSKPPRSFEIQARVLW
jgi:iron complex outermembrane recepter protein